MRRLLYILAVLFLLSSCHTGKFAYRSKPKPATSNGWSFTRPSSVPSTTTSKASNSDLSRAGSKLGVSVSSSDDARLLIESSSWIGVRYRAGGIDRNGVDCSGLVYAIYSRVYSKIIQRCSSADLFAKYCSRVSRSSLRQGDLVFFTTDNSGSRIGHSGIYLKGDKFIHASSSKGVIVSSLNDAYWNKHWFSGGRVR